MQLLNITVSQFLDGHNRFVDFEIISHHRGC
jgi:hypothetical protein